MFLLWWFFWSGGLVYILDNRGLGFGFWVGLGYCWEKEFKVLLVCVKFDFCFWRRELKWEFWFLVIIWWDCDLIIVDGFILGLGFIFFIELGGIIFWFCFYWLIVGLFLFFGNNIGYEAMFVVFVLESWFFTVGRLFIFCCFILFFMEVK